eukprot:m.49359 g.49359  ORF g.49359 m.49359 type:complete len:135 (+) comp10861_c0_seq2:95-499(+)
MLRNISHTHTLIIVHFGLQETKKWNNCNSSSCTRRKLTQHINIKTQYGREFVVTTEDYSYSLPLLYSTEEICQHEQQPATKTNQQTCEKKTKSSDVNAFVTANETTSQRQKQTTSRNKVRVSSATERGKWQCTH